MSYIVIARKWRPQSFDEIIGQEHITTTLKNAIEQDRVAHAYLFCGPRGIGKTTTARLVAKSLNCEKGPTPNPCNKCIPCQEISESRSLDIIEIDGASNRGIDDVRELRENVKFSPHHGKFKVYIIDEVHMLTPEAFNALLKTLEEPPKHVKFIFATTAAYKVIPTILSRCQRFNFRRLSNHDIAKKIKKITQKEKIKIEEAALFTIARSASGSMRDAESLLDQLATYCKGNITIKDVNSILGSVEEDVLHEFAQYILKRETASSIKLVNRIIDEGVDPAQFLQNLMEYFRSAMLLKEGKQTGELLEITKDEAEKLIRVIEALTTEDILYIMYSIINAKVSLRRASSKKIALELLAVKLTRKGSIVSLAEIMARISALEKNVSRAVLKGGGLVNNDSPKKDTPPAELSPDENETISPISESAPTDRPELYRIREAMSQVIKNIRQEKIYIASCLSEGKLVDFKNGVLTIGFLKKNRFHKESLEKAENKKIIEKHLTKVLNSKTTLEFGIIREDSGASGDKGTVEGKDGKSQESMKKTLSDPIIKSTLDIFDGSIMKFL